ncbi:MAG: hypothetical protein ACLRJV_09535 [Eubacteriales bacterium]
MKQEHPTHDPKPMDALSYYLQVQRSMPSLVKGISGLMKPMILTMT